MNAEAVAKRVMATPTPQEASVMVDCRVLAFAYLEARWALIRCAEVSGEDGEAVEAARSGAMKHPSVANWALGCVEQLRRDYDECCLAEHEAKP